MTSNVGSQMIMDYTGDDISSLDNQILETLRGHFRPEFLNRIDDIVILTESILNRCGRLLTCN